MRSEEHLHDHLLWLEGLEANVHADDRIELSKIESLGGLALNESNYMRSRPARQRKNADGFVFFTRDAPNRETIPGSCWITD